MGRKKFFVIFLGAVVLFAAGGYGAYEFFFRKKTAVVPEFIPRSSSAASPSPRRDKLVIEQIKSELNLTEYQIKRLRPIMKEESLRRDALVKKYAGGGQEGQPALQEELKLFRKYYEDMYSHILSDAQFEQYKKLRAAHYSTQE
ncbi:MAG: hypothetical protein PHC33_02450 [Candidatus Omnitrophica bacterium]|nr:hypothetical protein [Candidatus Omnitrophota bacterium]